jgi:hypothetical protein
LLADRLKASRTSVTIFPSANKAPVLEQQVSRNRAYRFREDHLKDLEVRQTDAFKDPDAPAESPLSPEEHGVGGLDRLYSVPPVQAFSADM